MDEHIEVLSLLIDAAGFLPRYSKSLSQKIVQKAKVLLRPDGVRLKYKELEVNPQRERGFRV